MNTFFKYPQRSQEKTLFFLCFYFFINDDDKITSILTSDSFKHSAYMHVLRRSYQEREGSKKTSISHSVSFVRVYRARVLLERGEGWTLEADN